MKTTLTILFFIWSFSQLNGQDVRKKGTKKNEETKTEETNKKSESTVTVISGTITDETDEEMIGVYIIQEGTVNGTTTDAKGRFKLSVDLSQPVKIRFSYIGYAPQYLTFDKSNAIKEIKIKMKEEVTSVSEVVISASRVEERIVESPVTIEKLDQIAIRENPSLNVYDAIITLKGVEQFGTSLLLKTINTRGFNSTTNLRFVQRVDGVDMQAPGLNFPVGVLNGPSDLDVENMELIPGAASALYGPNAFNGLMNIQTKDPFKYPGLSVSLKSGVNHIDQKDTSISPLVDLSVRYAKNFNNKIGFKVNFSGLKGRDWFANEFADVANYAGSVNHTLNDKPGYDGLNMYGDEVSLIFDQVSSSGLFNTTYSYFKNRL